MAVLTDIGRVHVCRVFALGVHAIVATEAISRDVRMVENRRRPQGARVAVVASVTGNNMAGRFSGCLKTVMAGTTAAVCSCVIHIRNRTPGRCRVASVTHGCRCNVIGWLH